MELGTELDDAAVAVLAREYGLGSVSRWRRIPVGTINSNYELETAAGHYFLRLNQGKTADDVRYEHGLVAELAARGVSTPCPLPTKHGDSFANFGDKQVSLFPWLEGEHRQGDAITEAVAREVGAALALLHDCGHDLAERFARSGIYTTADMEVRWRGFRDSADPELADAIAELGAEFEWLAGVASVREEASRGIIHGDLFPDNVLFKLQCDAEIAALIDFEQASVGSSIYDLAVCINAWCFDGQLRPGLVRAMAAGYGQRRCLRQADVAALHCELRASALRFAVTRITDIHLAGLERAGKDFREYLVRLSLWQTMGEAELVSLLASI